MFRLSLGSFHLATVENWGGRKCLSVSLIGNDEDENTVHSLYAYTDYHLASSANTHAAVQVGLHQSEFKWFTVTEIRHWYFFFSKWAPIKYLAFEIHFIFLLSSECPEMWSVMIKAPVIASVQYKNKP